MNQNALAEAAMLDYYEKQAAKGKSDHQIAIELSKRDAEQNAHIATQQSINSSQSKMSIRLNTPLSCVRDDELSGLPAE